MLLDLLMKMMNVAGFDDEHDEGEMNVNVFPQDLTDGFN